MSALPKNTSSMPLFFDSQISQFDGIRPEPLPVSPTVEQVIEYLQTDERLKNEITQARNYLEDELDADERDEHGKIITEEYNGIKNNLPAVTWSGQFTKRTLSGLVLFSGFISFDIDFINKKSSSKVIYKDEKKRALEAYNLIKQDEFTALAFGSVSATGVKGLVKIPEVRSNEEYKTYFRAYKQYIEKKTGVTLDNLSDITRLCFLSYQKNPYINHESSLFTDRIEDTTPTDPREQTDITKDPSLRAAVDVLIRYGIQSEIDRNTFVGLCAAFKRSGVSYNTFDLIMSKTPGYDKQGNFKIWNTVDHEHPGKHMTGASIISYAREADKQLWKDLRKKYLTEDSQEEESDGIGLATLVKRKLATRYQFKLNSVSDKINIIESGETRLMSDYEESRIRCWLLDNGFGKRDVISDVIKTVAYLHQFHPIEQYFKRLKWDGNDHFQKIADHFIEDDKTFPIFKTVFRAWCVGAVRRVFTGQHHQVLIFTGEQGKGKSFFARWLCPFEEYFLDAPMNPESNDTKIRMAENFIWEIGELGSTTRKSDVEALKQSISLEFPVFRRAHDKYDQRKKALASYIGTVNEDGAGFLNDPTGYRRWWPIRIAEINFDYTEHVDVNQLWAQAYHLYTESEDHCTIPEAIQKAIDSKIEREFSVSDPVEDLMLQLFDFTGDENDKIATVDILVELERNGFRGKGTRSDAMYLSKTIKNLNRQGYNAEKHSNGIFRGYKGLVMKRQADDKW